MPGYEMERFVESSDKTELTCSICRQIFKNPVVANCCLQSYCEECIQRWLKVHDTCPFDRKPLHVEELRAAPRILTNLLGKLQITCDFRDRGCPEVITLDQLREHSNDCRFNIRICSKCFCISKVSHDCVQELLALNKKDNELIASLRQEKQIFGQIIDGLKDSMSNTSQQIHDKYDKEIQLLKEENQKLIKSKTSYNKAFLSKPLSRTNSTHSLLDGKPTIYDMISEARKHLSQRDSVLESNTRDVVSQKIVEIVKNEIRINNNMYYICQNIVSKLDHEFGSSWCVITNYDKHGHNYTNSSCYVKLKFGKLTLKVYRTKFLDVPLMRRRVRDGKVSENIKIFDSDMSHQMINFVKNITFNALKKCNSLKAIATEIKVKMDNEFKGNWICFAHNFGDYCFNRKEKTFISFDVEELKITIFQSQ